VIVQIVDVTLLIECNGRAAKRLRKVYHQAGMVATLMKIQQLPLVLYLWHNRVLLE
jgi:hypothetical protein